MGVNVCGVESIHIPYMYIKKTCRGISIIQAFTSLLLVWNLKWQSTRLIAILTGWDNSWTNPTTQKCLWSLKCPQWDWLEPNQRWHGNRLYLEKCPIKPEHYGNLFFLRHLSYSYSMHNTTALGEQGVFHWNRGKRLGDSAIGVDPHVEICVTPNLDNDLHDLQLLTGWVRVRLGTNQLIFVSKRTHLIVWLVAT